MADKSIPEQQLQDLIDKDLSRAQIARRLGTSHGRVSYWIEKYNLKARSDRAGRKPSSALLDQLYELRVHILRLQSAEKKLIKQIMEGAS